MIFMWKSLKRVEVLIKCRRIFAHVSYAVGKGNMPLVTWCVGEMKDIAISSYSFPFCCSRLQFNSTRHHQTHAHNIITNYFHSHVTFLSLNIFVFNEIGVEMMFLHCQWSVCRRFNEFSTTVVGKKDFGITKESLIEFRSVEIFRFIAKP